MSKLSFALPLIFLLTGAPPLAAQAPDPVSADLTIAFLGDQGLGGDAEAVLALVRDEGADAVIHMGDFDYEDDPAAWNDQIDAILGPDFPYFASVGNHDQGDFYGPGGYQELLEARMDRLGIPWEGDLGVQSSFHFEGVFVVFVAPGSYGNGDSVYAPYLRDALAADDSVWSIAAWHKNMRRMQVGGKSNETGWGVYEESRRGGAIIATAHEHSYSRTHLLSDFTNQVVAGTQDPLVLAADDPATPEDEGRSFAFVSGLGGHSIRDQETGGPWWASVYTSDQGARSGALFGVFNYGGDPNLARFTFKNVDGQVVDDFFVTSSLVPAPPSVRIGDAAVVEGDSGSSDAILGVTLFAATGDEVSVGYATADGDATAGADYEETSGSLLFSGGVTEQSVRVPILGDESIEGEESLFVDLVASGGLIVTRPRGEIIILDDDAAPTPALLEVGTQGPGVVALDPPGGLYPPGTQVTLTAIAAPGHVFAGWDGDLAGAANPASLFMDGDRQVLAYFAALEPSLEQVESGAAENQGAVSTSAPLAAADGHLYLAAIAFKPDVAVTGISGLGLAWSPVRAQCAGRGQTGIAVWQARGEPAADGVVTATFSEAPQSSVLAVSRYAGVGEIDPQRAVSANSVGIAGDCSGGSDGDAYAVDLETATASSVVVVAAAPRHHDHLPGPGFVERAKLVTGGAGGAAGVSVADGPGGAPGTLSIQGGFSASVDWALVALEIPVASPFFLTLDPSPGGAIQADPPFGAHLPGDAVLLTALPAEGYGFVGWTGDLVGAENPATLVMSSDKLVGASFAPQYRVNLLPASGGSVALDPPGGVYGQGASVTLTALPAPRHGFIGWAGDLSGLANPATLVVDGNKTIAARFVSLFDLTVTPGPGGSVLVDPPDGPYEDGSSITLLALPDPGHRFGGWSGVLAGMGNPAELVIEADETIAASFVPQVALDVAAPVGGSVVLDPPGGVYDAGTLVRVTAVPDPLHRFGGWSGALGGSENPASVVVDANRSLAASFVRQHRLRVLPAPGGSVALDPPGGLYDEGATVTVTALPTVDAIFAGWERDLAGAPNPASVVVDRDLDVRARFVLPPALSEIASGTSGGSASVSTAGPLVAAEGDLYLAAIASKPHGVVTQVSGLGLAWSPVAVQCSARGQTGLALWQARGEPSGSGIVTATLSSAPQNAVLVVSRYASAGPLDPTGALSANTLGISGACDGGQDEDAYSHELDASGEGGLLYVAAAMRNRDHLPGGGLEERIELHRGSGGGVAGLSMADGRIGAPGPAAVHGAFDSRVDWAVVAVEIPGAPPEPTIVFNRRKRRY